MSATPVTFFSEGCRLVGDLYRPADLRSGDTRAGIVLCHGYTGVKDLYLPDNARVLTEAGYMVLAFEYVDETIQFHPEWVVNRIAPRPILFITTDDDRLVPPEESQALYDKAGEPKRLVVLEGYEALRGVRGTGLHRGHGRDRRLVPRVPAAPLSGCGAVTTGMQPAKRRSETGDCNG